MKTQKKIAMAAGGTVLAACLTLGGLAAANAATPSASTTTATSTSANTSAGTTASSAAKQAAAEKAAAAQASGTTAVPALPDKPYNWDEFIATLTPAQQTALLASQEAELAKHRAAGSAPGSTAVIEKLSYNVSALKKALGR